jgi:hypothetical protein
MGKSFIREEQCWIIGALNSILQPELHHAQVYFTLKIFLESNLIFHQQDFPPGIDLCDRQEKKRIVCC